MDERELADLLRELKEYRANTTVCTPTLILSKRSQTSVFFGWLIFIWFCVVSLFLLLVILKIFSTTLLPHDLKLCLVGVFAVLFFIVLVGLCLVDSLNSLDARLAKMLETMKKQEEHLYQQYMLTGKLLKEKSS